jgi:Nif-specific regulatory protein
MAALDPTQPLPMEEVEKRHIREVLEYCDWKREQAAEILGIDRKTLFNKIHRYNIVKTIGDD